MFRFIRKFTGSSPRFNRPRTGANQNRRVRLNLESLEAREVPSANPISAHPFVGPTVLAPAQHQSPHSARSLEAGEAPSANAFSAHSFVGPTVPAPAHQQSPIPSKQAPRALSVAGTPDHTAADSAADYDEALARNNFNPRPYLMQGYYALKAQDHAVSGFYRLEYYFAAFAHDYNMAFNCYATAIVNASYWAVYNPGVKGSGSDRAYGYVYGMFEGDAGYDMRFDSSLAQAYRAYARNMTAAYYTTPITSTIAGWWHFGNGYAYINPVSATQVDMYLPDGSGHYSKVTCTAWWLNHDVGAFNGATDLGQLSFTFSAWDSAHMSGKWTTGGSAQDLQWSRWYA